MGSKTILTKLEQAKWANNNNGAIIHKWSCRGYGNSKLLRGHDHELLAKASGSGYDRFGTAVGDMIEKLFPNELLKLAKRECKGKRNETRCESQKFYGLFYNKVTGKAYVDGACGRSCMEEILNKIGFELKYKGDCGSKNASGSEFYSIEPISKHTYKYL